MLHLIVECSFVDSANGFAFGGRNNDDNYSNGIWMLRTRDGGTKWDSTFLPHTSVHSDEFTVSALSFVDTLNGWIFGGTFFQGGLSDIIIRTSDGGKTWTLDAIGLSTNIGDAQMLDALHGWAVTLDGTVLGYGLLTSVVEPLPQVPSGYILRQNYPNPFNNSTIIEYEIPEASQVTLSIYDVTGRLIRTLVSQYQLSGVYRTEVDLSALSSGTYMYRIRAGSFSDSKKLLLVK